MMKLLYNTEDWREILAAEIDLAEHTYGQVFDQECYSDLADQLCTNVLNRLQYAGVDYVQSHRQSCGSFVIIQTGSPAEIDIFNSAVDAELATIDFNARVHELASI